MTERLKRPAAPFLGLEPWAGLAAAMQIVSMSPIELVDAQDALAAISTAVGDDVDRRWLPGRIEHDLVPAKRLPLRSHTTWSSVTIRLIERTTSSGAF